MHAYTHIYACTTCSECVCRCVCWCQKKHLCNIHTCPGTSAQNTCSKVNTTPTAKKCTYIHMHTHMHTHTYAHEHTRAFMTPPNTQRHWQRDSQPMHKYAYTYIYICIYMYINTYTHAHAYTYMHARLDTYIHTHTYAHTYSMYICTHASTPGTKALQRLRQELLQTPEAVHVSFVPRNQPHLAPSMLRLHCTHFLRHQYPSTPHPLFTTYLRTVCGPRWAQFYCSTLRYTIEYMTLRSSVQLHNGPLRSCRKIRGKAAVQQSPSRRARRRPSPRLHNVAVHEITKGQRRTTEPPAAVHHTSRQRAAQTTPAHLH